MDGSQSQQVLPQSEAHQQLGVLVGEWDGVTRTWFEPEQLADESPTAGTVRPVLDGRFLLHEYWGAFGGEPTQGLAIYGYNSGERRFEAAWVDSFHTGTSIMSSMGTGTDRGFSVLGGYKDPEGGRDWGWRTEIEVVDQDRWVLTAHNISPEGEAARAVETRWTRRGSSPSGA